MYFKQIFQMLSAIKVGHVQFSHCSLFLCCLSFVICSSNELWEARWPSGRASDSEARSRGFDPHSGPRVVSLSKIHLPPKKVLVKPRKWWLRPDMTEKLLTEM